MGVVEGSVSWDDLSDRVLDSGDQTYSGRERAVQSSRTSVETRADWAWLFVLTGIMTVPFALVAWLMS
jgi:hypothetical protein